MDAEVGATPDAGGTERFDARGNSNFGSVSVGSTSE